MKEDEITHDHMENLTLLLLYLSSWDEDPKRKLSKEPILRAWKGYDFDILDILTDKGFIYGSKRSKSVYLTEEGIAQARAVLDELSGL